MKRDDIDRLIMEVSKGDNNAFAKLYELTIKGVYVFAYSYIRERTAAEDIAQDVFIQVKLKAHTYKAGSNARAWLLQITKNLAIDHLRKQKRTQSYLAKEEDGESGFYCQDLDGSPAVKHMLSVLADDEREIVILHVFWGYKHREIAQIVNLPMGTVLWKYNVAIKKLKNYKEDV